MEYMDVWVSLLYDPLDYVLEHARLYDSTSEKVRIWKKIGGIQFWIDINSKSNQINIYELISVCPYPVNTRMMLETT